MDPLQRIESSSSSVGSLHRVKVGPGGGEITPRRNQQATIKTDDRIINHITPLEIDVTPSSASHHHHRRKRRGGSISSGGGGDGGVGTQTTVVSGIIRSALHHVQSQWAILLAGQVLSFLMATSGAAQASLSFDCQLSAPTLSLTLFYFCLAFCLIPICRENMAKKKKLRITHDLELQSYEMTLTTEKTNGTISPNNAHNAESDNSNKPSLSQSPTAESNGSVSSESSASPLSHHQNHSAIQTSTVLPQYTFLFGYIPLATPAYVYFGMALLDVYANYFTVRAFRYTTITSVTLLDALAIPAAMILSKCFLKRQYGTIHILGAVLCMTGVVLNVFQDYEDEIKYKVKHQDLNADGSDDNAEFPYRIYGDIMAVAGGLLFGASSVVGEVAVRDLGGPNEYVGMLGFFACIICAVQTFLVERDDIAEFMGREVVPGTKCSETSARVLLIAFVIIMVINYLGRAWFLQVSEAAFLNLSLLTGDMWSVLFSVITEGIAPQAFFYVALTITLSGVFVYEMAPSPIQDHHHDHIHSHQIKQSDSMEEYEDNMHDEIEKEH